MKVEIYEDGFTGRYIDIEWKEEWEFDEFLAETGFFDDPAIKLDSKLIEFEAYAHKERSFLCEITIGGLQRFFICMEFKDLFHFISSNHHLLKKDESKFFRACGDVYNRDNIDMVSIEGSHSNFSLKAYHENGEISELYSGLDRWQANRLIESIFDC